MYWGTPCGAMARTCICCFPEPKSREQSRGVYRRELAADLTLQDRCRHDDRRVERVGHTRLEHVQVASRDTAGHQRPAHCGITGDARARGELSPDPGYRVAFDHGRTGRRSSRRPGTARPGVTPRGGTVPAVVEYGEAQDQRPGGRGRDEDTGHPVAAAGARLPLGRPAQARASPRDPGGRPVSGGSRPGLALPRRLGLRGLGLCALASAALAPAGTPSSLRSGGAATASGLAGTAFCAGAAGSAVTEITGIGSVFASPGDEVPGLAAGGATVA